MAPPGWHWRCRHTFELLEVGRPAAKGPDHRPTLRTLHRLDDRAAAPRQKLTLTLATNSLLAGFCDYRAGLLVAKRELINSLLRLTELAGKYRTNEPLLAAAGILIVFPPALIALALNRQVRGVLGGSS